MVLFHDVIQILPPDHLDWGRAAKALQHFVDGFDAGCVRTALIDGDLSWKTITFKHSSEEFPNGRFVPTS
jgi:hypothetical protein